MTDLATYQTPTAAVAPATGVELATVTTQATQNTVDLVAWANELGAAHHIATAISRTEFVPKEFRGDPDKTATAILYGKSIGLDPLAALSNVFVVHGKPAIYSRTMVALAQRAGVDFRRVEATEQQVTVQAKRKSDRDWQTFTWSMARATKAGYTSNQKYMTDPIGMLTAKAFTEAVRVVAPDVLMGIAVSEEIELGDYQDSPTTLAQAPAAVGAKKVQRKPAKKAVAQAPAAPPAPPVPPAPPAVEEPPAEEPQEPQQTLPETPAPAEPAPEVKYVSKVDQGRISAGLEELGVSERAAKLDVVRLWSGLADLKGVNGLTHDQAQHILARIEDEKQKAFAQ